MIKLKNGLKIKNKGVVKSVKCIYYFMTLVRYEKTYYVNKEIIIYILDPLIRTIVNEYYNNPIKY